MRLAVRDGLADLADQLLSVPTDKGAKRGSEGPLAGRGDGRWNCRKPQSPSPQVHLGDGTLTPSPNHTADRSIRAQRWLS